MSLAETGSIDCVEQKKKGKGASRDRGLRKDRRRSATNSFDEADWTGCDTGRRGAKGDLGSGCVAEGTE